jgi:hypothetical protein
VVSEKGGISMRDKTDKEVRLCGSKYELDGEPPPPADVLLIFASQWDARWAGIAQQPPEGYVTFLPLTCDAHKFLEWTVGFGIVGTWDGYSVCVREKGDKADDFYQGEADYFYQCCLNGSLVVEFADGARMCIDQEIVENIVDETERYQSKNDR